LVAVQNLFTGLIFIKSVIVWLLDKSNFMKNNNNLGMCGEGTLTPFLSTTILCLLAYIASGF